MTAYLKDPGEIYRRSFATVRAEADLGGLPPDVAEIAIRIVHACGMPDIVADLRYSADVVEAAKAALTAGAPILADCEMVAAGITGDHRVLCTLNAPETAGLAAEFGTTRSAAAVELWRPHLDRAVVAIGNAPTALFHLLDLVRDGGPRPAAILALPVGFVGAAESKQALADDPQGVPFLTLLGRRGGSAMTAAAINAVLRAAPRP
jgi:precorrin-8X/cobalt-precorrin-8 methylmutase